MTAVTGPSLADAVRAENFPVAMHLLGRRLRAQLLAVYAVARLTDDTGDELDGDRLAALDRIDAELDAAACGRATHPVFVGLQPVLAALDCGVGPFHDLVEANRLDQRVVSYDTFEDLRGYCQLSAAPIGRIVLSILGATSPSRVAHSDEVCVALQLVEHLQDVGEDARRGRVYLPAETLERFGCSHDELVAPRASPSLRGVVAHECGRARSLLAHAVPLAASLPIRGRLAVAGFAAGGHAALDAIESSGFDVLAVACRADRRRVARRMLQVLREGVGATWS